MSKKAVYWFLGVCALPTVWYLIGGLTGGLVGKNLLELLPVFIFGLPWSYFLVWILPQTLPNNILTSLIFMLIMMIPLYLNIYIVFFIIHKIANRGSNIIH